MLHKEVFQKICLRAALRLEIDLFVSALNAQLPKFFSRGRDPQAWKIDALSFPWTVQGLFAFPPFSMIPKVLEKVASEEVDLLLVTPFWPRRPWFPLFFKLLVGISAEFATSRDFFFVLAPIINATSECTIPSHFLAVVR